MLGFKNVSIEKACLMRFTLGLHSIQNKILLLTENQSLLNQVLFVFSNQKLNMLWYSFTGSSSVPLWRMQLLSKKHPGLVKYPNDKTFHIHVR